MSDIACRWRGEATRGKRFACRSPKILVMGGGVSLATCEQCHCRDHEPAGDHAPSLPVAIPILGCPHRSPEPTGYCGTCAGSGAKYDCEKFDETVMLRPRKWMRDCQGCEENPNRISLPLVTM